MSKLATYGSRFLQGAALAVLAACSNEIAVSRITAPRIAPRSPSSVIGIASGGIVQVCRDASAPPLSIVLSSASGTGYTLASSPITSLTPGGCADALTKTDPTDITNAFVTLTASTAAAGTFSYTCVSNGALCGAASGVNGAVAGASGPHGSTVTFAFVAAPPPLFVIGDAEAHGIGAIVNFWGAQWWKNNFMSGLVSPGVASFKGYATNVDNFCGGAWSTRPGNSPPPPATIAGTIRIIVTSTVQKKGPDISGNIVQILTVDQDGGYGPNPGHAGNGTVVSVACPQ
jgi:hypothetical protein